jgi:phosphate butyryltransferase
MRGLGIETPKAAVLAAVEMVNPDMPATIDAACLTLMAERGQIKGGRVDGPLALDNAISAESAREKGISSPVIGDADILLVPNIETGNAVGKSLIYFAGATMAGLVRGAKAPIVLTSRSETARGRLVSLAWAVLQAGGAVGGA